MSRYAWWFISAILCFMGVCACAVTVMPGEEWKMTVTWVSCAVGAIFSALMAQRKKSANKN
jgi:hypothetical protein